MRLVRPLVLLLLVPGFTFAAVSASRAAPAKLKALVVNGQQSHNWRVTTTALKLSLEGSGRFVVDVSTSPPEKSPPEAWARWRPPFARYDVVIPYYNGEMWPPEVRSSFVAYVRGGGGVLIVHAANNAFPGWKEYEEMVGLLGRRTIDFGERITFDDRGTLIRVPKGQGFPRYGHGKQHPFFITARAEHPITRGMPPKWLHAQDELYHAMRGSARNITILNSAFSPKEQLGTGEHEPMTWVIPYGKGRVATTLMGHHMGEVPEPPALQCIGFQTLVARGAEWAATGKVTIPIPPNFPTAEKASIGPPIPQP